MICCLELIIMLNSDKQQHNRKNIRLKKNITFAFFYSEWKTDYHIKPVIARYGGRASLPPDKNITLPGALLLLPTGILCNGRPGLFFKTQTKIIYFN